MEVKRVEETRKCWRAATGFVGIARGGGTWKENEGERKEQEAEREEEEREGKEEEGEGEEEMGEAMVGTYSVPLS